MSRASRYRRAFYLGLGLCVFLIGINLIRYVSQHAGSQPIDAALSGIERSAARFAMQGQPVPAFSLTSLANNTPINASIFDNQWTLLNIWASWCLPCKAEHDYLLQLSQTQNVPIIGVNYRDKRETAQRVLEQTGNPYQTVIFDPKGALALDLGSIVTPETYLIDPNGIIQFRYSGGLNDHIWLTHFAPRLAAIIKQPESDAKDN